MKKEFNKLVRDKVPNIIIGKAYPFKARKCTDDEFPIALGNKLIEEANEIKEAISKYLAPSSVEVFLKENIFNETEIHGRVEVEYEKFSKKVQIESRTLGDIAINHIVPTAVSYQNRLIENLCGLKQLFAADEFEVLAEDRKDLIREISTHVTAIKKLVKQMTDDRHKANHESENEEAKAIAYDKIVRPVMEEIRSHIDELELVIDDDIWPLPKYRELLFAR